MSVYCSLEDAFAGPMNPGKHKKKRSGTKESTVPGALGGVPDPDRPAEVPPVDPMGPATSAVGSGHPEAAIALNDFFPIPGGGGGDSTEPEEWSKAFMLEPSAIPQYRADGSAPVNGKSTLWRKVPVPTAAAPMSLSAPANDINSDIHKRLDILAKQLESLTQIKPMQNTAELFLFIAIGLLLLLAVDTLLRVATSVVLAAGGKMKGGARFRGLYRPKLR